MSTFDTTNVTNMKITFSGCDNLKTIYVSNKFVTDNVTNSSRMFYDDEKLVGGNGTTYNYYLEDYDASVSDKTMAKIDKPGQPGYFTDCIFLSI